MQLPTRLALLVAAVALPLIGLGIEAAWQGYQTDRTRAGTVLVDEAGALAQAVDGEFDRTRAALQVLALAPSLATGDLASFERLITDVSVRLDGQPIGLFAPDGERLLSTVWPPGRRPDGLAPSAAARRAAETGHEVVSDLMQGGVSHRWFVAVYIPQFGPGPDGSRRVRTVLGGGIWAERLASLLQRQDVPQRPGALAAILDPSGTVVARTLAGPQTIGTAARPEIMERLRREDRGLIERALSLEGTPGVVAFAHAPASRYIVAFALPQAAFEAPLWAALARLIGFGSVLVACGLAAATAVARGIVGSVRRVAGAAAGGGTRTGLPELDELAAALAGTAAERARAEAELQAANAELTSVLESIGDGFYAIDPYWRFVYVNHRALELFGRDSAALLGRRFEEVFPRVEGTEVQARYREVMADGQAREFRAHSPIIDRWTAYSVYPRRGGGIAVQFRDVSAQMEAELALRASEAQLRLAQRIGGLGSFDWTPQAGTSVLSDEYAAIHGLKPGTRTGEWNDLLARVHPDDRAGFAAALRAALESAPGYEIEFRIHRPSDGALRWLVTRAEIFRDATGKPARVFGAVQDVTAWREMQRRQDEALALLNTLLDNAPVGVAFFDCAHRYVRLNETLARMDALPVEAHIGRTIRELMPAGADTMEAVVDEVFRTGVPVFDLEFTAPPPGAPGAVRHWHAGFYPVPDPAGGVLWVGAALLDVTEHRRDREQLRRLNEDLEAQVRAEVAAREAAQTRLAHAERMQALGELAGGIAHDFNNVLQAVSGGAALIERRPGDPASVLRLSRRIIDAAARGGATTRRLLAFARRDELSAEPVDLAALVGGLQEMIAPALGRTMQVEVACAPGLPQVLADRSQLETVLVNLAVNARDAMPEGGTLRIQAAQETVADGAAHPAGLAPGCYARLEVRDTGHGMDAAVLARAAEPFFTTKEKGKGTGLGLAMARGFAEQTGGALSLASTPGQGATVTLWLPVLGDQATATANRADIAPPPPRRVLLVDDDDLVRETVAAQLEDAGYTVRTADNGPAALAALEEAPDVDVLLTDFSMPGMNGMVLILAVRERLPGLPAILLTGFAGEAGELAARRAPHRFALVRKPAPEDELVARIEALLVEP